jgi:hypothetical protein
MFCINCNVYHRIKFTRYWQLQSHISSQSLSHNLMDITIIWICHPYDILTVTSQRAYQNIEYKNNFIPEEDFVEVLTWNLNFW